ncbi:MAG: prepilin peptidase [Lachnospiraceae bacterium]|nr:prepilin peptidase [Lachnospiraceae bacterium]
MWKQMIVMLFLIILGILDARKRAVPTVLLGCGMVLAVGSAIWEYATGDRKLLSLILSIGPGAGMLLVAWMTRKMGYADGVVIMCIGLTLGYRSSMFLLCGSLLLLSVVCIVLLCLRKVNRNSRMPYLPFLGMTFILQLLMGV